MLIRSKLFRAGGTRVELGKGKDARKYHFKGADTSPKAPHDDPDEDHVTNVTDADDIATFLAIKEGYDIHSSELKKPAAAAAVKAADKVEDQAQDTKAKAEAQAAAKARDYSNMKKPDLIKRIVEHPKFKGKAPHGTMPQPKLVAQLEALDAAT